MTNLKKKTDYTQILKWVCVAMMVLSIACQFLPYFQYESVTEESHRAHVLSGGKEPEVMEIRKISLADYTWFTRDHEDLFGEWDTGYYNFEGETFSQNDSIMATFLGIVLIAFGLVFFLWKKKSLWPCLFAIAAGGYATYMFLVDPAGVYKPFDGMALRPGESPLDPMVEKSFVGGINYWPNLIANILLLAAGIAVAVPWVIRIYKWFTVKKRHY